MKVLHIIGADLSKQSIDLATSEKQHLRIANTTRGFQQLLPWLHHLNIDPHQAMIVMEHTGLYSYRLEQFLFKEHVAFTKVSALAIKRSMGLVRGKNDRIDAIRIARYGVEKQDQLLPCQLQSKALQDLKILYSCRNGLVTTRAGMINQVKAYELTGMSKKGLPIQSHLQLIKNFDRQIQKVEDQIAALIEVEEDLSHTYQLLQSEKAVGKIVALAMIVKTGNFTRFSTARKFACYSGTAPFEHTSGISIRGKTRVSHLADKDMKSKLHQAAKCAIQFDRELKEYYQKRVAAGKSKMATLNIVCNKILYRMFAIIKRQTPYIENYRATA